MAEIPLPPAPTPGDLIVKAIDTAHEEKAEDGFRFHLGGSMIGRECEREIWYGWRWTTKVKHPGRILRLFRRGHNEEFTFVDDLRDIGIEYVDINPATGKQFQFSRYNGHVGGSCDGLARNVPGYGDEPFIGEFKTHSKKSFNTLFAAKNKAAPGESPLKKAKPEHYGQCQIYMYWQGFKYALYLAVCKDDDRLYCEIVEFDEIYAAQLHEKAGRIVRNPVPPARCSEDPDFYKCKFCDHRETCHGEKVAVKTCRSCISATPNLEGDSWTCSQGRSMAANRQLTGCDDHRYIPDLIPFAEPIEADAENRSIKYQLIATDATAEPEYFYNGSRDDGHYTSGEIEHLNPALIRDAGLALLRDKFDGTIIGTTDIAAADSTEPPF